MQSPDEPLEGSDAAAELARYATELGDAVERALPSWVVRKVTERLTDLRGGVAPDEQAAAEQAGDEARDSVMPKVRALLATDVDEQQANPLALLRAAAVYPTRVLQDAGVPPVVRDEVAERLFPDDIYDVVPAAFADINPSVHEPGLVWGAAKAHVVLARRRAEGRR